MMANFAGLPENNKPSSKVLRPPGGGSSDIFGSDVPSTPRSVKNHMQSNIFSCEKGSVKNNGDQPRRAQKNTDSYTRLFGEVERPFTPAKNHMKSNIGFSGNSENGNCNTTTNGNGHHATSGRNGKFENGGSSSSASSVSSSTENLKLNGLSKTEIDETSDVSSEKPVTQNNIPNEEKSNLSNDNPSSKSSSSIKNTETTENSDKSDNSEKSDKAEKAEKTEKSEKIEIGDHLPQQNTHNSEDSRSELTTSTPCSEKSTSETSESNKSVPRNPITGCGLGAQGPRSRRNNGRRDGNPVTGEGYKPAGAEINTTIPSLNGANQVINKNRIPPGGFSSGLW